MPEGNAAEECLIIMVPTDMFDPSIPLPGGREPAAALAQLRRSAADAAVVPATAGRKYRARFEKRGNGRRSGKAKRPPTSRRLAVGGRFALPDLQFTTFYGLKQEAN